MNFDLERIRKSAKLSQSQLGKKLDVDYRTIGNWEKGKSYPNAEQLWRISEVCHCSPNDILGWTQEDAHILSDSYERELIENYRSSTPERQDRLIDTARDFAAMSKDAAKRDELSSPQVSA